MTTGADKRQHPRYAIELDCEITVGDVVVVGRTHDISKGGFSMLARSPVPVHAPGQVKLALVFSENEFSEHLTLPATPMWCTPIKNAYQIGVKFVMLDPQNRGYLDLFIKFLDAGDEGDDSTE
jgi:PilZ domain-containing protein